MEVDLLKVDLVVELITYILDLEIHQDQCD